MRRDRLSDLFTYVRNVKSITNHLSKHKALDPGSFTGKFYQTFKWENGIIFYNLFQKVGVKERLSKVLLRPALL